MRSKRIKVRGEVEAVYHCMTRTVNGASPWRQKLPAGGSRGPADGFYGRVLQCHRSLIFGKGGDPWTVKGRVMRREQVAKVLEEQDGVLPKAAVLRCRVRYFTEML